MVGINLNGVVHGRELKSVANEIFSKAKSHNPSAKSDASPRDFEKNPFRDFNDSREFIPQETKTAKRGFEQNTLQISKTIQEIINSRAAIDKYSRFAIKEPDEKLGGLFANKTSKKGIGINSATKDREGKNPFAFLYNLPKNQKGPLNEDQLRSIFEALANKNYI